MLTKSEKTLRGVKIFAGLGEDDLTELADLCAWETFEPNEQIITHQDTENDVLLVAAGRARVVIYSVSGKTVIFRDIGPGDFIGELSAIDASPRSASVEAIEACLVAHMPSTVFLGALQRHPSVLMATTLHLTSQVRSLTSRVFEFSTLAVQNRIHAELLRLSKDTVRDDGSSMISPAPTQAEIANRISTHREAVTREIQRLTKVGLVKREGRALRITDVRRLSKMVEEVLGEII